MNNEPLIAIVGPTAVGKTALSIKLALELGGEIVSGDSMQVYKTMDIGTAKASVEEMAQAPHHLIDILDPTEPWAVSMFQERALRAIAEIRSRGNVPILVGGTGLYVQAVTHEFSFADAKADEDYRKQMEHYLYEHGHLLYTIS
ncbi:tRNA (adenosine(37)-N6)-dimethylallyltransferase MiaA [Bacillus sp. JCM 19041]|uniref:tRNA (adenosine(37)-N6)-dimethylallyltransferase MiaA n=1 Tax=Bacillus sp. JCM 19041 TaxID=1460637 RepID=UPI00336A2F19